MTMTKVIFVFGSNLAGRHGKGAAYDAKVKWGAVNGVGSGRTGDCYAIPTKDKQLKVRPLDQIGKDVHKFIEYAKSNPEYLFYVTAFGQGLAGYSREQILSVFPDLDTLPYNIVFTKEWIRK